MCLQKKNFNCSYKEDLTLHHYTEVVAKMLQWVQNNKGGHFMTANQIAYWKLEEDKRSNRAKELEENRSNLQNELLTAERNGETERANRARERLTENELDIKENLAKLEVIKTSSVVALNAAKTFESGTQSLKNKASIASSVIGLVG